MLTQEELLAKARRIKLIIMDVDGVLTDGRIIYTSGGEELKCFDVRDGYGIAVAIRQGFIIAWISGRASEVTSLRARELGIEKVYQGIHDKVQALDQLVEELGVVMEEVMYIGDDVIDNAVMKTVGIGVAVADAHPDTISVADWVTACRGGHGAVREAIDLVMEASM